MIVVNLADGFCSIGRCKTELNTNLQSNDFKAIKLLEMIYFF